MLLTVSDGSASIVNFCCFKSCDVDQSRGFHNVHYICVLRTLKLSFIFTTALPKAYYEICLCSEIAPIRWMLVGGNVSVGGASADSDNKGNRKDGLIQYFS